MQKRAAYIIATVTPFIIIISYFSLNLRGHVYVTVMNWNNTSLAVGSPSHLPTFQTDLREDPYHKYKILTQASTTGFRISTKKQQNAITYTTKTVLSFKPLEKQTTQNGGENKPATQTAKNSGKNISSVPPSQDYGKIFSSIMENMTIVTAYFDLGSFQKGYGSRFTSELYFSWTKTFAYLVNPLVVYTDSVKFENLMNKHREKFPLKTFIIRIQRKDIWAFQILDQIKSVFSQPGYPKHHPNTVIPEYSCAQHAKYAAVADAIRRKYFDTEFYAWLDIGYFRDIVSSTSYFRLNAPANLDRSKLAMNKVYDVSLSAHPYNIIRNNDVWVGGGMFIGTQKLVLKFEKLYQRTVRYFLSKNLMNTDQQIIYSLYSKEGRKEINPDVELQLFEPKSPGNPWFYQGYLCRQVLFTSSDHKS